MRFSFAGMDDFFAAVLRLKTKEECENFFEDICTIRELKDISQRLEVARLLKEGKNYVEISQAVGASAATISRVNKCLMYGSGGYEAVLSVGNKKK